MNADGYRSCFVRLRRSTQDEGHGGASGRGRRPRRPLQRMCGRARGHVLLRPHFPGSAGLRPPPTRGRASFRPWCAPSLAGAGAKVSAAAGSRGGWTGGSPPRPPPLGPRPLGFAQDKPSASSLMRARVGGNSMTTDDHRWTQILLRPPAADYAGRGPRRRERPRPAPAPPFAADVRQSSRARPAPPALPGLRRTPAPTDSRGRVLPAIVRPHVAGAGREDNQGG
jgi:hypothetical protein